ncbi:MAG: endo-1,4-beta-xylanase [Bacteroidales bacterium]|nr:endo-1,4-beta-xylanase [Bacteroidales bacterium]
MKNLLFCKRSWGIIVFAVLFSIFIFSEEQSMAQIAAGKCKFLGNITGYSVPTDFSDYWNQVTPENGGKWSFIEGTMDNMSWTYLDLAYNFAIDNSYPFKWHTFVWGSQEPDWVSDLIPSEQLAEVEELIQLVSGRYTNVDYVDVVNEPLHAPPSYKTAIGGSGTTGYDWVVWAFKKARQYFPDAKLHINDYGILNSSTNTNKYISIINILKDSSLIDGIGVQAHGLEGTDISLIVSNLNKLAATGLPVYVTEYDVNIADDNAQLLKYQQQFPVFWEHYAVKGITLWGYKQGSIWKEDAYLVRNDGTKRPALTWLNNYVPTTTDQICISGINDPKISSFSGNIFPNPVSNGTISISSQLEIQRIKIFSLNNKLIQDIEIFNQKFLTLDLDLEQGIYLIQLESGQNSSIQKIVVL